MVALTCNLSTCKAGGFVRSAAATQRIGGQSHETLFQKTKYKERKAGGTRHKGSMPATRELGCSFEFQAEPHSSTTPTSA